MAKHSTGGRQYVHILLDPVTYLKLKASNENMSELGNRLFSQYFELQDKNQESPDEIELNEKISKLNKVIKDAQEQLSQYTIMLSKIRKEKFDLEKEKDEKDLAMYDAMRRSQTFREVGL